MSYGFRTQGSDALGTDPHSCQSNVPQQGTALVLIWMQNEYRTVQTVFVIDMCGSLSQPYPDDPEPPLKEYMLLSLTAVSAMYQIQELLSR